MSVPNPLISITLVDVAIPDGTLAAIPLPQTLQVLTLCNVTPKLTPSDLPILPSSLTYLDLSHNAFGSGSGLAVALSKLTSLHSLSLRNNRLSAARLDSLISHPALHSLTALNISHNASVARPTSIFASALESVGASLTTLMASGIDLDDTGLDALVAVLSPFGILARLDLSGNALSPAGIQVLAQALDSLPSLGALRVEGNPLDMSDLGPLADAIALSRSLAFISTGCSFDASSTSLVLPLDTLTIHSKSLTSLVLDPHVLSLPSLRSLFASLSPDRAPLLSVLSLAGNVLSPDQGAGALAEWLAQTPPKLLRVLDLSRTSLGDAGLDRITRVLPPQLVRLGLAENGLTDHSLGLLRTIAVRCPTLEWLDASRNAMPGLFPDHPGYTLASLPLPPPGETETGLLRIPDLGLISLDASVVSGPPPVALLAAGVASTSVSALSLIMDEYYSDLRDVPKGVIKYALSLGLSLGCSDVVRELVTRLKASSCSPVSYVSVQEVNRAGARSAAGGSTPAIQALVKNELFGRVTQSQNSSRRLGWIPVDARVHRAVAQGELGGFRVLDMLRLQGMGLAEVVSALMTRVAVGRRGEELTPLDIAVQRGDARTVAHILALLSTNEVTAAYPMVDDESDLRVSPLERAVMCGHHNVVLALLQNDVMRAAIPRARRVEGRAGDHAIQEVLERESGFDKVTSPRRSTGWCGSCWASARSHFWEAVEPFSAPALLALVALWMKEHPEHVRTRVGQSWVGLVLGLVVLGVLVPVVVFGEQVGAAVLLGLVAAACVGVVGRRYPYMEVRGSGALRPWWVACVGVVIEFVVLLGCVLPGGHVLLGYVRDDPVFDVSFWVAAGLAVLLLHHARMWSARGAWTAVWGHLGLTLVSCGSERYADVRQVCALLLGILGLGSHVWSHEVTSRVCRHPRSPSVLLIVLSSVWISVWLGLVSSSLDSPDLAVGIVGAVFGFVRAGLGWLHGWESGVGVGISVSGVVLCVAGAVVAAQER